jgi:hypothetical protein
MKYIGDHGVPLWMSVDMDCHYNDYRESFINNGLLNSSEVKEIDILYDYLKTKYGDDYDEEFWMDRKHLFVHGYWSDLRNTGAG